LISLARVL